MNRFAAVRAQIDDVIDLFTPARANDNSDDSFDTLPRDAVVILLEKRRDLLAG